MISLCREGGAQTTVLDWPDLRTVVDLEAHPNYRTYMQQACENKNVQIISMYEMIRGLLEPFFLDQCHFSPRGNYLAAAYIAEQLRPLLPVQCRNYPNSWQYDSQQFNAETFLQREGADAMVNHCANLDVWLQQHHSIASIHWEIARIGLLIPDECALLAEYFLKRAAEMAPGIGPVFFRLDEIFKIRYGSEGRLCEWQRMSKIAPYSEAPGLLYLMGCIYEETGDLAKALEFVEKASSAEQRTQYTVLEEKIRQRLKTSEDSSRQRK
jgi:hypothetical protein